MIKYECETPGCNALVVTEEALGADVYDGDIRGRVFNWTAANGQRLTIMMEQQGSDRPQQFCYACMFKRIRTMLDEKFPAPKSSFMPADPWPEYHPEEGLVFDDPTDTGDTSESKELSELYAQGKLQEPRPDLASEKPQRTCICPTRDSDGSIVWQDPACPVHSPGGSSGEG